MRSSSCPPATRSSSPALASASCGSLERRLLSPRQDYKQEPPDQLANRAARRTLARARVGRIATCADRRQLARGGQPGERDQHCRERHVPDRYELHDVPGCVGSELEAPRERSEQEERPREASSEHRRAHPGAVIPNLREPEPGVKRREDEDEGERVRRDGQQRDDAEGEQRGHLAGKFLLDRDLSTWKQAFARNEPARNREAGEHPECEQWAIAREVGIR